MIDCSKVALEEKEFLRYHFRGTDEKEPLSAKWDV